MGISPSVPTHNNKMLIALSKLLSLPLSGVQSKGPNNQLQYGCESPFIRSPCVNKSG